MQVSLLALPLLQELAVLSVKLHRRAIPHWRRGKSEVFSTRSRRTFPQTLESPSSLRFSRFLVEGVGSAFLLVLTVSSAADPS